MRIAIIGSNGQIGNALVAEFQKAHEVFPLSHEEMDVCNFSHTRRVLTDAKPNFVINTAAFHKTDECEDNPDKSFLVNASAVRNLALVCKDIGATLVHFSTDYVFDGRLGRPYTESDAPNPINVYGVSKLSGELFVRNITARHFIIRPSGVFGKAKKEGKENFVQKMIRLASSGSELRVVDDQFFSPTYARDLASKLAELIATEKYGTYHITNSGSCSWFEFAREILKIAGLRNEVKPVKSSEFGAKAARPMFSVLESESLPAAGLSKMRPWREALKDYIKEIRSG
ncbi:MAG: dTDP-4-dehydrorhamnose reductase [Candidatus Aenigmatarchaeota archaeon]